VVGAPVGTRVLTGEVLGPRSVGRFVSGLGSDTRKVGTEEGFRSVG
jgi:hypothetical protein